MAIFSITLSPVAARVKKATNRHLIDPDWSMHKGICDAINSDRRQAKHAIKAIKKRLQHKKPKVQYFALMLLETVMKNCGDYVHQQVIEHNILQEMTKIVKKEHPQVSYAKAKTQMPIIKKILELLDSWQEAFGGQRGKYPQYYWAYAELRRPGMAFPQRSLDKPPILTPPFQSASTHPKAHGVLSNTSRGLGEGMISDVGNLSVADLNFIRNVMALLSDIVQILNPRDRAAAKDDVTTELVNQCHTNKKRLVQLLSSSGDEELLRQGIELINDLQSLLEKHNAVVSGTSMPPEVSKPALKGKNPTSAPAVNNQIESEDDDEFAQLARRKSITGNRNNSLNDSNPFSPNWRDAATATTSSSTSEGISSSESKALVMLDPPTSVQIRKEVPDMIDLSSLTLTTSSEPSPHTSVTPPPASSRQVYSTFSPPSGQGSFHSSQPYPTSTGFSPYNSYVAPWAQHALLAPQQQFSPQPQSFQYTYNYPTVPTPQWAASSDIPNPMPFNTYQWTPHANYLAMPLQRYTSFGSTGNYDPAFEETQGNEVLEKEEVPTGYSARPLRNHNSFDLKTNYATTADGETDLNSKLKQAASQADYASRPLQSYNSFASNTSPTATGATKEDTNIKTDMDCSF